LPIDIGAVTVTLDTPATLDVKIGG